MTGKVFQPARLDELAAMVGLSVKEANKAEVSFLLLSIRESVMRSVASVPIETPPALFFDPRWHSSYVGSVAKKGGARWSR